MKDLLPKVFERDPEKRLTARQALNHKFFTESTETDTEESGDGREELETMWQNLNVPTYGSGKKRRRVSSGNPYFFSNPRFKMCYPKSI